MTLTLAAARRLQSWLAETAPVASSFALLEGPSRTTELVDHLATLSNDHHTGVETSWTELTAHHADRPSGRIRLEGHVYGQVLGEIAATGPSVPVHLTPRLGRPVVLQPSEWLLAEMPEADAHEPTVLQLTARGRRGRALGMLALLGAITAGSALFLGPCAIAVPPVLLLSRPTRTLLRPLIAPTEERVEVGLDRERLWIVREVPGEPRIETSYPRAEVLGVLPDHSLILRKRRSVLEVESVLDPASNPARWKAVADLVRSRWGQVPADLRRPDGTNQHTAAEMATGSAPDAEPR